MSKTMRLTVVMTRPIQYYSPWFTPRTVTDVSEVSVGQIWRDSREIRRKIYLGYFDNPICQACNVGEAQV